MEHGIDVSRHQGNIDFEAVKNSGRVKFVLIKAGGSDGGFYKDGRFREYVDGFRNVGIPVLGAYYYVGKDCVSTEDGLADADRFCDIIDGIGIPYAIVDLESTDPPMKAGVTDACIAFMDRCAERGYESMIYASDISGFKDKLDINRLAGYKKWVARYGGNAPEYVSDYAIWQYSSVENIDGISENTVDCDYLYDEEMIAYINNASGETNTGSWTREQAVGYVRGLYRGLLYRDYGDGENEAIIEALMGNMTRVEAFDAIRGTDDYNDEYSKKDLIAACYRVMRYGDSASDEEIDYWQQYTPDEIKHGILYSEELNSRYGV